MLKAIADWFLEVFYSWFGMCVAALIVYTFFGICGWASIMLFNLALFIASTPWEKKNAEPS